MTRDEAFLLDVMQEWQRASAHAGFDDSEVRLWLCTGYDLDKERPGAVYYKPHLSIDDDRFLTPAQKHEAESDTYSGRHRVAIFEDFRLTDDDLGDTLIPVLGAMLRHELEHARQQEQCGNDVLDIDDQFLDHAVRIKAGGLPGGTELYNLKPMEQDANAASAMYLREHHAEHVDRILEGPSAQLARSNTPPETLDTLLARTVANLFQYRDICNGFTDGIPFAKRLDVYDARAGYLWRQLDEEGFKQRCSSSSVGDSGGENGT